MTSISEQLDFELAWQRLKHDDREHAFVRRPYETHVVEHDLESWLTSVRDEIDSDSYSPSSISFCDVPKQKAAIRTGNHLSIKDRLVYIACVSACQPAIYDALEWSQGKIDFAYRLPHNHKRKDWFSNIYKGWSDFREKSLKRIEDSEFVVVTDIASYYDSINIKTLISDLKSLGAPEHPLRILSACLNRWAVFEGSGIPQGNSASHVLAKVYLNNIDKNLRNMGYQHFRYSDDFRLFCDSFPEAKKSMIDITRLMRERGLRLQTAKTDILGADEAARRISKVQGIIKRVRDQFVKEVRAQITVDGPYVGLVEVDQALRESTEDVSIDVLRKAYKRYFLSGEHEFEKSLFHFLIKRLGRQKDRTALSHSLVLLESHPEETRYILRYIEDVRAVSEVESDLIEFMRSEEAVYNYQIYQIVEWRVKARPEPSEAFLQLIREIALDPARPPYLRGACRKCLEEYGTDADLERLLSSYSGLTPPCQTEVICAIRRLETSRRNAFYGRVSDDGDMHERSVRYAKSK